MRAVSIGLAGRFAYDYETIRYKADKLQSVNPRATVRFFCPINAVSIAGLVPLDPDGSVIELVMGGNGFLTKPWRLD